MQGNERTGKPTLEQVAMRAGVSRATVSRVINGSTRVSPRTVATVEEAIAHLEYVPNEAARALAGTRHRKVEANRQDAVALTVPQNGGRLFAEPYLVPLIHGVDDVLEHTELHPMTTIRRACEQRRRMSRLFASRWVAGALLLGVQDNDPLPDLLEHLKVPAVLGGRRYADETLSYVDCDNAGGARTAVGHLLRERRRVATITGPLDMYVARCRLAGHREAIAEAGAADPDDESLVASGDFTEQGGLRAMREILQRRPDVDGVFAAADAMAVGALRALRQSGRRVPDDVALIGFGDSAVARHTDPPLTTVRLPLREMGRSMARALVEQITDRSASPCRLVLNPELVRRASA